MPSKSSSEGGDGGGGGGNERPHRRERRGLGVGAAFGAAVGVGGGGGGGERDRDHHHRDRGDRHNRSSNNDPTDSDNFPIEPAINLNNICGEKLVMNRRTLLVQKRLGEGGFAFVFLVRDVTPSADGDGDGEGESSDQQQGESSSSGKGVRGNLFSVTQALHLGQSNHNKESKENNRGDRDSNNNNNNNNDPNAPDSSTESPGGGSSGNAGGKEMVLKVTSIQNRDFREMAEKEAMLLRRMSHPSIVKCYDVAHRCRDGKVSPQHMILMEFCEKGHALDVIQRMMKQGPIIVGVPSDHQPGGGIGAGGGAGGAGGGGTAGAGGGGGHVGANPNHRYFSIKELIVSFGQICNAVSYLHAQRPPIVHRDLKLENFLVTRGGAQYKLCDFGSAIFGHVSLETSRERNDADDVIQKTTTQMYRAPEMIDLYMSGKLTQSTDVWALGCCLYTMAFFQNCFEEGSNLAILGRNYKIPNGHGYPDSLVELIDRMLTIDCDARADMTEVITCLSSIYSRKPLPPRRRVPPPTSPRGGRADVSPAGAGGGDGFLSDGGGNSFDNMSSSNSATTPGGGGSRTSSSSTRGGGGGGGGSSSGAAHPSTTAGGLHSPSQGGGGGGSTTPRGRDRRASASDRGSRRFGTYRTDGQGIQDSEKMKQQQVKKQAKKLDPNSAAARRKSAAVRGRDASPPMTPRGTTASSGVKTRGLTPERIRPPPGDGGGNTPTSKIVRRKSTGDSSPSSLGSGKQQAQIPTRAGGSNSNSSGRHHPQAPPPNNMDLSPGFDPPPPPGGVRSGDGFMGGKMAPPEATSGNGRSSSRTRPSSKNRDDAIGSTAAAGAGAADGFEAAFDDSFGAFSSSNNPFAANTGRGASLTRQDSNDPFDFESITNNGTRSRTRSTTVPGTTDAFSNDGIAAFPSFDSTGLASAGSRGSGSFDGKSRPYLQSEARADDGFGSTSKVKFPSSSSSGHRRSASSSSSASSKRKPKGSKQRSLRNLFISPGGSAGTSSFESIEENGQKEGGCGGGTVDKIGDLEPDRTFEEV